MSVKLLPNFPRIQEHFVLCYCSTKCYRYEHYWCQFFFQLNSYSHKECHPNSYMFCKCGQTNDLKVYIYGRQLQSQYNRYFSLPLREKNSTTWLSSWKWDWIKILNLTTCNFMNICIWFQALIISESEELQHVLKACDIFLLFNSPVILTCWFIQCIFDYIVNASELLQIHPSECSFTW